MEVVRILEKHRELLSRPLDLEILNIIRSLVNEAQNMELLEEEIKFILLTVGINGESYINEFILNKEVKLKSYFLELLKTLNLLLENNTSVIVMQKLKLIMAVITNFKDDEYSVIMKIVASNCYYTTYDFLIKIIESQSLNNDKKLMIINRAIDYNDKLEVSYIEFILNNVVVGSLDEHEFQEIVKFAFSRGKWYPVYRLLISDLTLSYKRIALSYYIKIINKHFKNDINSKEELEKWFKKSIFEIVFKRANSEEEYKTMLNYVSSDSNDIILACLRTNSLDMDRQERIFNAFQDIDSDYIEQLISLPLIKKINILDLDFILGIVKGLFNNLFNSDDERKKELLKAKLQALLKVFREEYLDNDLRFKYVLHIICNSDSLFVVDAVGEFAGDDFSFYYSDMEFKRAVEILGDTSVIFREEYILTSKYFLFVRLFTNCNVPFMDKNALMDIALEENYRNIQILIEILNKKGMQNSNMEKILGEKVNIFNIDLMGVKKLRELIKSS